MYGFWKKQAVKVVITEEYNATSHSLLHDVTGRHIDYIRLSLTDRCNFRCIYCMPHGGQSFLPHSSIVTYEELLRLAGVFSSLGIRHYKVTGGEPFCRKGAISFIRELAGMEGVDEVTLTTNGSLVEPYLAELVESGVSTVTFSCDAFDDEAFQNICRTDTSVGILRRAMDAAANLGMKVKINTVPLKDYNDATLVPLTRYALERGHQIRFIELMPVGSGKTLAGIPQVEVFERMGREFGRLTRVSRKMGNGPAVLYEVEGYPGFIGFISAMTGKFCSICNRVRLTSTGFLKTCLCHDVGVDLKTAMQRGVSDKELTSIIIDAVREKPAGHTFSFAPSLEREFFMHSIGG